LSNQVPLQSTWKQHSTQDVVEHCTGTDTFGYARSGINPPKVLQARDMPHAALMRQVRMPAPVEEYGYGLVTSVSYLFTKLCFLV
jgi:hypothetical protein